MQDLTDFEVSLLAYLEQLRKQKPNSYLSYRRSAHEDPLFFHNGTQCREPSEKESNYLFSRACTIF